MNRKLPIGVVLVALAVAAPAPGQAPAPGLGSGVRDRAGLFSAEAVREADQVLREVERDSRWQAVIETVETLGGQPAPERALATAKGLNLRGVYVLIAPKERKVQVQASPSAEPTFTKPKVDAIVGAVTAAFRVKEFDRGLRDAVAQIRQAARAQPAPAAAAATAPSRPRRESRGKVASGAIIDGAKLFSPAVVSEAEQALREIGRTSRLRVIIETVETLGGRTAEEQATIAIESRDIHGVYILIPKQEHQVWVQPSESAEGTFTKSRNAAIVAALTAAFQAQQFDRGLREAVTGLRQAVAAAPPGASASAPAATRAVAPPRSPTSPPAPGRAEDRVPSPPAPAAPRATGPAAGRATPAPAGTAPKSGLLILGLLVAGVILVIWLLRSLTRGRRADQYAPTPGAGGSPAGQFVGGTPAYGPSGRPAPPVGGPPGYGPAGRPVGGAPGYGPGPAYPAAGGYGPPPPQGGGGGFLSSALGGLGGAIAGNILYDKFGRPHPQQPTSPGDAVPHETHHLPPEAGFPPAGAAPLPDGGPAHETADPNAGVGGDWGSPEAPAPEPAAGDEWGNDAAAGGDWGASEAAAGGDWSAPDPGAGGDWGGGDADAGAGGDWGAGDASTEGDWGGGDAGGGGDWGGDTGGGETGSDAGAGGSW
ncbi:MAG TPA: TPM domain-containing protein [Isosphaeraceae bacterium]